MNRIVRILLIASGTLCVALGLLGILVPVLPTTPFLLLAAFSYARSSERFHHWLLTNRWFGEYIKNYHQDRGMLPRDKALTLVVLWLTIGFTALVATSVWWIRLILLVVGTGVTVHLLQIKSLRPTSRVKMAEKPSLPKEPGR